MARVASSAGVVMRHAVVDSASRSAYCASSARAARAWSTRRRPGARPVGHLLRERVPEDVDGLLRSRLLVQELQPSQLGEVRLEAARTLPELAEEPEGELAPQHGGGLQDGPALLGEALDAGEEDLLERPGDARPGRAVPFSATARASSSRKSGFPSARATMAWVRLGQGPRPGAESGRCWRRPRPTAAAARSASRTTSRCRPGGSRAGRSGSAGSALPARLSTNAARYSSEVRSIQCTFSMASTRGRRRLPFSPSWRWVSNVQALMASGLRTASRSVPSRMPRSWRRYGAPSAGSIRPPRARGGPSPDRLRAVGLEDPRSGRAGCRAGAGRGCHSRVWEGSPSR